MTLREHLSHLLWLTSFPPNEHPSVVREWTQFAERKARSLAARGPELAELPQMLAQAMQQRSKESGPDQQCTGPTSTTPEPMQLDAQRP